MKFNWRSEWPHLVLLAGMFALAAATWSGAPERIVMHWDINGRPDGFGGRFEGLLGIPLLALGLYLLMLFLPRIDPGRANYETFASAYATFRLALVVTMAGLYGVIQLWIRGRRVNVETVVPLLMGVLFIVIGNLLGKVRPNWFVGIRTPWTLSSKLAWTHTHRAGGWLFVVMGVIVMAVALARSAWAMWTTIGMGAAGVLSLVVYSYMLWRRDPDKMPPAGTLPAGNP